MIGLMSWLVTSKLGRLLLSGFLTTLAVGLMVWAVFKRGQDYEKLKQAARDVDNLKERIKVDADISRLPPSARRDKLREWSR